MNERDNSSTTSPNHEQKTLSRRLKAALGVLAGAAVVTGVAAGMGEHNTNSDHVAPQSANPIEVTVDSMSTAQSAGEVGYKVVSDMEAVGGALAPSMTGSDIENPMPIIVPVEPTAEVGLPITGQETPEAILTPDEEARLVIGPEEAGQIDAILLEPVLAAEEPEPTIAPVESVAVAGESEPAGPTIVESQQIPEQVIEPVPVGGVENLMIGVYIQPGEDVTQALAMVLAQAGFPNVSSDQLFEGLAADPSIGPSAIFEGVTLEYDQAAGEYQMQGETVVETHLTVAAAEWVWNTILGQEQ